MSDFLHITFDFSKDMHKCLSLDTPIVLSNKLILLLLSLLILDRHNGHILEDHSNFVDELPSLFTLAQHLNRIFICRTYSLAILSAASAKMIERSPISLTSGDKRFL